MLPENSSKLLIGKPIKKADSFKSPFPKEGLGGFVII
jgi:hypothetical protein